MKCIEEKNSRNQSKYKIKYSIITPVYNSFDSMGEYFESLCNQSYKNFEVIIVDDSSDDSSYEKLIDYKNSSELQITVLRTEKNSGPGHARNIGMFVAKGKWITFIDSDDWVTIDFLQRVNAVIEKENVDCVIYDYYIEREGKKRVIAKSMIDMNEGSVTVAECVMNLTNHTVGKFYKLDKCMRNNIMFPSIRRCEDVAFTILAASVCKNIYYMKDVLYFYYQRRNSLSNSLKMDEMDMVKAFAILQEKLEEKYPKEIKEKSIRDLLYGCILIMCKVGKSNKEILDYIKKYEKRYPKWEKCEMVRKVGKAKRVFLLLIYYRQIKILKCLSYIHTKITTG